MAETSTQSRVAPPATLDKIFHTLAAGDLAKFEAFFGRMRNAYPEDVGRACIRHLGHHGLDEAGRKITHWLRTLPSYGDFLLDPALLTLEEAERAAKIMRESDGRFSVKILEAFHEELGVEALNRALIILQATGDRAPFIPRLLNLTAHKDERIRSKAVKALCELRPNYGLVKRQLQSEDTRVRANVVEALWAVPGEESRHVFRMAENDAHHRVVVNALLGLYHQNDTAALDRIHKLTAHKAAHFRAAAIWAIGFIRDPNSIPLLEQLSQISPDADVRQKATHILAEMTAAVPEVEKHITAEAALIGALPSKESQAATTAEDERKRAKEKPEPATKKPEFEAPAFKMF